MDSSFDSFSVCGEDSLDSSEVAVICCSDGCYHFDKIREKQDYWSLEAINTLRARGHCGFYGHLTFETCSCVCEHTQMTFLNRGTKNNFVLERTMPTEVANLVGQKRNAIGHHILKFSFISFKYTLDSNCRSAKPYSRMCERKSYAHFDFVMLTQFYLEFISPCFEFRRTWGSFCRPLSVRWMTVYSQCSFLALCFHGKY